MYKYYFAFNTVFVAACLGRPWWPNAILIYCHCSLHDKLANKFGFIISIGANALSHRVMSWVNTCRFRVGFRCESAFVPCQYSFCGLLLYNPGDDRCHTVATCIPDPNLILTLNLTLNLDYRRGFKLELQPFYFPKRLS